VVFLCPAAGLPQCGGEGVSALQWQGERALLLELKAKGKGQTKCNFWPSNLWAGRGTNNLTPEKKLLMKYAEPVQENQEGGHDPHRAVAPTEEAMTRTGP
jgi:hypothetical protein